MVVQFDLLPVLVAVGSLVALGLIIWLVMVLAQFDHMLGSLAERHSTSKSEMLTLLEIMNARIEDKNS